MSEVNNEKNVFIETLEWIRGKMLGIEKELNKLFQGDTASFEALFKSVYKRSAPVIFKLSGTLGKRIRD